MQFCKSSYAGVIVKTEGSVRKTQKDTFSLQKVKNGTSNLRSLYVHGLSTIALIKQNFVKK